MKIGVPRETAPNERRVALVPETVDRLVKKGHAILVEFGAGVEAGFTDDAFSAAGAQLTDSPSNADLVIRVHAPDEEQIKSLKAGTVAVSVLNARTSPDLVQSLADANVTALAMELVPRIARAQRMDVLSSQASLAGYKAVLIAANSLGKYLPMLMTAAGTIPPSRVLVLGAGVAGLQAIATAKRLGAVVEAFDVRTAAAEQVESLGGRFLRMPESKDAEAAGGYARAQTDEEQERQRAFLKSHLAEADIVITTAAIPGRRAPLLVTKDMAEAMRPGSVVVDLAAETGGNVELTVAGETIIHNGIVLHGPINVPSMMPLHASLMYSRNIAALLDLLIDKEGNLNLNLGDEVINAMCVAHAGEARHELGRKAG